MSLKPEPIYPVPQETACIAKAAFPKGSTFIRMRDELGVLYQDEAFASLFPHDGQPALTPWRLALVTIMQFAEGLSDPQAADAVRARLDWKYAISLELEDSSFDFSVLSEFRSRLVEGNAEYLLFDTMLDHFKQRGLVKAGSRQRTDATHVLVQAITSTRAFGMRRSRYEGLAKTHLQHLACATAINIVRVLAWLEEPSIAPTRTSHFAALAA